MNEEKLIATRESFGKALAELENDKMEYFEIDAKSIIEKLQFSIEKK